MDEHKWIEGHTVTPTNDSYKLSLEYDGKKQVFEIGGLHLFCHPLHRRYKETHAMEDKGVGGTDCVRGLREYMACQWGTIEVREDRVRFLFGLMSPEEAAAHEAEVARMWEENREYTRKFVAIRDALYDVQCAAVEDAGHWQIGWAHERAIEALRPLADREINGGPVVSRAEFAEAIKRRRIEAAGDTSRPVLPAKHEDTRRQEFITIWNAWAARCARAGVPGPGSWMDSPDLPRGIERWIYSRRHRNGGYYVYD